MLGARDESDHSHQAAADASALRAGPATGQEDPLSGPDGGGDGNEGGLPRPRSVPERVCPHCAALSQVAGDFCPECGRRFFGESSPSRLSGRAKIAILGVVALLVLGAAGAAVAIKLHHDNQVTAQRRAAAAARARAAAVALAGQRAAAQAKQQQQQQQQQQQAAETTTRQGEETTLQQSITKDAQQQVNNGVLTGPILSTTCTPVSGGSSTNLSSSTGTYECIAANKINSDGTSSGYRFSGTIDFSAGTETWHLGS